jgi:hypothetical protein
MTEAAAALEHWFSNLTPESLAHLDRYYAADARFKDPFNDVSGIEAIHNIFAHMFASTIDPRFKVLDRALSEQAVWFYWVFTFRARKRDYRVEGTSRVRFNSDGRVSEHIDFWDPAAGIWIRLPVIGTVIGWLTRLFAA